jgi:ABC-type phosphate/phosphonate transport system permease subunit
MSVTTKESYLPSVGRMIIDFLRAVLIVAACLLLAVSVGLALFAGAVAVAFQ